MGDPHTVVLQRGGRYWKYCPSWPKVCSTEKKQKLVEAYYFDDSDDQSVSDINPLIRRPPSQASACHTHIITGYLSAVEAIVLVAYLGSLLGLSIVQRDYLYQEIKLNSTTSSVPDTMVASFCMIHVLVWIIVGVMDRVVQWCHQVLRKKGYLKFYRQMKNVRRIPFVIVSLANAAMLLYISLLYYLGIGRDSELSNYHPIYTLYIIVGVEVIITLPCLIYYIIRATIFNCARQAPDVIHDTYSGPESPTASVSVVGFRDGEDLDELLERQADMIRYLQQHNANLGRRILELQAQAME